FQAEDGIRDRNVTGVQTCALPILDLALAVVRRTRAGRSPFSPDKMHIHHRLLEIGHSHRNAVLSMYAIAALVAFGTVLVSLVSGWTAVSLLCVAAALTAGFVLVPPRHSNGNGIRS